MLQLPWPSASLLGIPGCLLRPARRCLGANRACLLAWLESALASLAFASLKIKFLAVRELAYLSCQVLADLPAIRVCWNVFGGELCLCFGVFCTSVQTKLLSVQHRGAAIRSSLQVLCPASQQVSCVPCGAWKPARFQPTSRAEGIKAFGHGMLMQDLKSAPAPAICIPHSRTLDKEFLSSENLFIWWHQPWCSEFALLPESSVALLTTQARCSSCVTLGNQMALRSFAALLQRQAQLFLFLFLFCYFLIPTMLFRVLRDI